MVDVTLSLAERKTGGASAGGGISAHGAADGALPGFIGSASFSQRNVLGLGQKLAATLEVRAVGVVATTADPEALRALGLLDFFEVVAVPHAWTRQDVDIILATAAERPAGGPLRREWQRLLEDGPARDRAAEGILARHAHRALPIKRLVRCFQLASSLADDARPEALDDILARLLPYSTPDAGHLLSL